jgi:hypothetical protein
LSRTSRSPSTKARTASAPGAAAGRKETPAAEIPASTEACRTKSRRVGPPVSRTRRS